jgi:hypothetical protein
MIIIRFAELESERKALGYVVGRFPFTSRATGEMFVPAAALPYLALEGVRFTVEGPATYEQIIAAARSAATSADQ